MNVKEDSYEIRFAYKEEWQDAVILVWRTFLEFEAPDYSERGIESFNDFITDHTLYKMFLSGAYQMMVALDNKKIVGVISLRDTAYISLLFVEEAYHKKGIGRKLINAMCSYLFREEGVTRVTVNSSPYAVGFYHRIGFKDTDEEKLLDGIRYTPMEFYI